MPRKAVPPTITPAVRDDPVEFVKQILHGNPHQGQVEVLRGYKQTTAVEWGRQAGKSRGISWLAEWYLTTHANREILLLAPSLDQTRIIFDQIAADFRRPPLSLLVDGKVKEYPFPEIRLLNGSKLYARGANSPQFIRGHSPHLVIGDEAAFFKDGTISQVIEPLQTVTSMFPDSALILISTPFGEGEFNSIARQCQQEATEGNPKFAYFHLTSLDNPYANIERLLAIRDRYGEDSLIWKQEYLAIADLDYMAVFSSKDIKWALQNYPFADQFNIPPINTHRYVQGVDLANRRDYYVSTILDITDKDVAHLIHMDRWNQRGWAVNKSNVRENYHRFNRCSTCIDATTLAESVVEELSDVHPEGYKFTGSSAKYEVVHELVRMFAEHRITIPNVPIILD